MIEKLAYDLPHVSFVLIGPGQHHLFPDLKNIYFLRPKPYSCIPGYLQHADVGVIPFNVKTYPDLIHSVNPLKLYEYMACGLPVVATSWQELRAMGSPAFLATSPEEFQEGLQEALTKPALKEEYQTFAKNQDWSRKAKQLIEEI